MDATKVDRVTQITQSGVAGIPGVRASGIVYAQSSDPALRSCDYKLIDQPQDQPLVAAAKAGFVKTGLATTDELDGEGTMYLVSDDPLDAAQVIVTIDVPTNPTATNGTTSYGTEHLVAFVTQTSDTVSQTGIVPSH
jgi:hypothetical protein